MSVEVDLLAVEAALCLQAAESLTELHKLRPPALAAETLVSNVLQGAESVRQGAESVKACL